MLKIFTGLREDLRGMPLKQAVRDADKTIYIDLLPAPKKGEIALVTCDAGGDHIVPLLIVSEKGGYVNFRFCDERNLEAPRSMPITDKLTIFGKGLDVLLKVERLSDRQFLVQLPGVEISDGDVLISSAGRGSTIERAAMDYAKKISCRTIVLDAMKSTRRELICPDFLR